MLGLHRVKKINGLNFHMLKEHRARGLKKTCCPLLILFLVPSVNSGNSPQCLSFSLKLCKDGFQYAGGGSDFYLVGESACLLCDGRRATQEPTSTATASSIAASGFPVKPQTSHIYLFLFHVNFNSGECPWAGLDTRSKMNQCLGSSAMPSSKAEQLLPNMGTPAVSQGQAGEVNPSESLPFEMHFKH